MRKVCMAPTFRPDNVRSTLRFPALTQSCPAVRRGDMELCEEQISFRKSQPQMKGVGPDIEMRVAEQQFQN